MDEHHYLRQKGHQLLAAGYAPIPIPQGSKAPGVANWQSLEITPQRIDKWLANGSATAGVGVRTGRLCAIDLDVDDKSTVDWLVGWCRAHIGPAPAKTGRAPRTTLLYRCEAPSRKRTSPLYEDMLESRHQVEILGIGQQTVLYAVHPGTNRPYSWDGDLPPLDELTEVTQAQLTALLAELEQIADAAGWDTVGSATQPQQGNPDGDEDEQFLANRKPPLDLTDEEVAEHLSHLDPDMDHGPWVKVGMAVHHQYAGSEDGYQLWSDWSSPSYKYDEADTRRTWNSFDTEPVRNLRTFASVIHLANEVQAKAEAPLVLQQVDPEAQGLQQVNLSGYMQVKLDPPRFVIDPWLPRRVVTLLGGHGGMGKSYFALVLAAHVACGQGFAGMAVEQGRVVFVSLEDEGPLVAYRLRCLTEEYRLDPAAIERNLVVMDGTLAFSALVQENQRGTELLRTKGLEEVKERTRSATLTVIDNSSDAFDANENVRRLVRGFVRELTEIARGSDGAVMLLAHVDKSAARFGAAGNSYSGSTAWHNSARSRLALIDRERGVDGMRVVHEKANLGKRANDVPLLFGPHGVPVVDQLAVERGAGGMDLDAEQAILAAVVEAERIGVMVPVKITPGNGSAQQALAGVPGYPEWLLDTEGKRVAGRALAALLSDDRLVKEEYRKAGNRSKAQRLMVPPGVDP